MRGIRTVVTDYQQLPANLPVPTDDGAAAHLPGARVPRLLLPATDGSTVDLSALGSGRSIVYLFPLTGRPGDAMPDGWDEIPGARGCTTEACDFRDHHELLMLRVPITCSDCPARPWNIRAR